MRSKACCLSLVIALSGASVSFARSQNTAGNPTVSPTPSSSTAVMDQDEDVRGAFLTTRPKTVDKPAKNSGTARPSRRRPRTSTTGTSSSGTSSSSGNTGTTSSGNNGSTTTKDPRGAKQRLGLGLTLFMRDSNGLAVRVDPTREFHKGDRVRVLLETNMDGHLYIFNTTDGGDPVMIYPDAQLDEAGNYIRAHVPFEIPSSVATEERLRWFRFDEHAGTERLYFVFTREPLQNVPIEDDLIKFCADKKEQCAWHPAADVWTALQKESSAPLQLAKAQKDGAAQSPAEHDAATRGIGLAQDDPEPSLVMMTASASPSMLVTALDLVHK